MKMTFKLFQLKFFRILLLFLFSRLSVSKITLPRPSSSGNDSTLEISFIGNEENEVSPPPSIEDSSSSSASVPLPNRSNTGGNLSDTLRM